MEIVTLTKPTAICEHRVSGSRFISQSLPINDKSAVDAILAHIRGVYPDATHWCYAYRLAPPGSEIIDFGADAGEPGGSAGLPMLNVLRQQELVDAMCWVVRYYGGTKLGIPGLIAAYSKGVRLSLTDKSVKPWIAMIEVRVVLPYQLADRVKRELDKRGGAITDDDYAEMVTMAISIPVAEVEPFCAQLTEWGGGRVKIFR